MFFLFVTCIKLWLYDISRKTFISITSPLATIQADGYEELMADFEEGELGTPGEILENDMFDLSHRPDILLSIHLTYY